ncbi:FAD-dependent monooxygenase [Rhodococcus sp. BE178]|uniref:FAD-dependent monooxygenase n=1 Tax=Rhodococcus sp. BE178 TaxID=2817737 RepID=UPI003D246AD1
MPSRESLTGHDTEVLVVGGGPTGMTVAGDLARAGRQVVVLERWSSINPASRAFITMPRTLEVLDSRGLADDLLADGGVTLHYPRDRGQHRLVGKHATEVPLHEGRLTAIQREHPGFVLVHENGATPVPTHLTQTRRSDGGPALLVRPD